MQKEVILHIDGLTKSFADNIILNNVALDIELGEIFGIIGISGCGKTTLLRSLVGCPPPDKGTITVTAHGKELNLRTDKRKIQRIIGFASQHPSFYPKLTVEENLEHFGILYGVEEDELDKQSNELLKVTKLDAFSDRCADQLSYGMQKRLGIACALIHNPSILILDEPTADLDPLLRNEIWKLVTRINKQGTTVIVASHLLGEVEAMCHRLGMLHKGALVYTGTFTDMKQRYCPRQEVSLKIQSRLYDAILDTLKNNKEITASTKNEQLQLLTTNPEKTVDAIMRHVQEMDDKIEFLHVAPPSLEELFTLIEEE